MSATDVLLALMALGVGCILAWGCGAGARLILFASAMVVSAMLFLPGSQLTTLVGRDTTRCLEQLAATTPWPLSDWMHFVIFVWLGMLLWVGRPDLRGWKGWALMVVLGVAAEVAQGLAPDREPRLNDVLLNLAGGMAGLVIGILLSSAIIWVRKGLRDARPET